MTTTMTTAATITATLTIEMEIRRNRAMREMCVKHDAPQEALDTLDTRYIELEDQRRALMGQLPQPNYEMLDAKQAAYRRLIEAMA